MTVGELREKLEGIDPKIKVLVNREQNHDSNFYDIGDASLSKGAASRFDGKIRIMFDADGPDRLFLISTEEA
jgi:hypothetical protein